MALYGGFAGTETDLSQRDLSAGHTSILSGEIGNSSIVTDNLYHVVTGSSTNNTAILDGFTITKGYSSNYGGGMYIYNGNPTLRNLTFNLNTAVSGGGLALYISNSSLSQISFTNNSATSYGGGLYTYGSTSAITNAVFTGNTAVYGGGVYINNSNSQPPFVGPTLTHVTFTNNQALYTAAASGGYGGGMYLASSSPSLVDVTFTQNSAISSGTGSGGQGGGIYATASSPNLSQVVFNGNTANGARYGGTGGGMYSYSGSPTLSNCTFTTNTATGNNVSYQYGGGGGGLYIYFGTLSLTDSVFTGNVSQNYYGGGLSLIASTQAVISKVNFNSNQALANYGKSTGGGALYINSTSTSLTDVNFNANSAPITGWSLQNDAVNSWGGAVLIYNASPTFTRVNFTGNSAVLGGGIYNSYGSNPLLTDVTFSGNTALDSGGGMLNYYNSSPTLRNVLFNNNSAGTNNVQSQPHCQSDASTCGGNSGGGGMYNAGGTGSDYVLISPILENVTFIGNQGGYGGAIYNDNHANPVLRNVTIAQNTALGVDILDGSGNPTGSRTAGLGAGLYNVMESNPQVINSILWGNVLDNSTRTDQIDSATTDYQGAPDTSAAQVTYSIVQSGFDGVGNKDGSPLLGSLGAYGGFTETLPLLPGSAAIDAGNDGTGNCATADQRGITRPKGAHCDMGAFESQGFLMQKSSGDAQKVKVNLAFPAPLQVQVTSSYGEPVNGGLVIYTSPTSGASAILTGSPATISGGLVSVSAQANSVPGAYAVQVASSGAQPVAFNLTNITGGYRLFIPITIR